MGKIKPSVDCSSVIKALDKIKNACETSPVVFDRVLKDMNSRAPGKVASAVTSVYGIKKSEITGKKKISKKPIGRVYARGGELASFELIYYGRILTPLHFGMTPKERPKEKKKYKVKVKIKKQAKVFKPDSQEGGVFLAPTQKTSKQIPWMRHSEITSDISPIKTLSLPQMVDNKEVRATIDVEIGELYKKRFDNALKQHLSKKLK